MRHRHHASLAVAIAAHSTCLEGLTFVKPHGVPRTTLLGQNHVTSNDLNPTPDGAKEEDSQAVECLHSPSSSTANYVEMVYSANFVPEFVLLGFRAPTTKPTTIRPVQRTSPQGCSLLSMQLQHRHGTPDAASSCDSTPPFLHSEDIDSDDDGTLISTIV